LKINLIELPVRTLLLVARLALPVLPVVFSVVFLKKKYIVNYGYSLKKLKIHHAALSNGPVHRYFGSFFKVRLDQSEHITGSCTQCGNCCLNQDCFFLEKIEDQKYQCGIYHSPFRQFSNCGAFPISEEDIQRYSCPSYEFKPTRVIPIASLKSDTYEIPSK
jgi:hypothetical protein